MLLVGMLIGIILTIASVLALYIMSIETDEGDEWKWKQF